MKIILKKSFIQFFLYIILFLFLVFANYFRNHDKKPLIKVSKQETSLNFSPTFFKIFGLGLQRLYSSFIWIVTLAESDLEHYKQKDLNSWMYLRFKSIIDIDPNFYEVYNCGGLYLSVVKDDDAGAKEIYDRGLKIFPNDKDLLFNTAIHYHLELFDTENAIKFYERLTNISGTPQFYLSLVSKLKADSGDLEAAFEAAKQSLTRDNLDEDIKKRLQINAYSLKAEIDLRCLNEKRRPNSNSNQCHKKDYFGNDYIFDENLKEYKATKEWEKIRTHHHKKTHRSSP